MVAWVVLCGLLYTCPAVCQEEGPAADDPALAPESEGPRGFPSPAAADTVHTNLWLTEALMGEIVSVAAGFLPNGPSRVMLLNEGGTDSDDLFGSVATRTLTDLGHSLYLAAPDSVPAPPLDYVFAFKVIGVELSYPEVGRTLGIWQRWVERDVSVTAAVDVSEADSGLLLFKDILERRFSDRVDNDDFDDVESDLYDFTTAEKAGSGWQNRIEEIVVLGTLVALIAVYFSNTGN